MKGRTDKSKERVHEMEAENGLQSGSDGNSSREMSTEIEESTVSMESGDGGRSSEVESEDERRGSEGSSELEEETSSGSSEGEAKENTSLTVFIKGLNYDLTEHDMKCEMEKIGKVVRVGIPMTNDKRRNKGFGYVEFSRECDVEKALKLNNTKFMGREIVVDMAKPRSNKQRHTIYVSNIPFECDRRKLKQYFSSMGEVVGMSFPFDRENNRLKGYGFVDFADRDEYEHVLRKKLKFEDSVLYQRPANKGGKPMGRDDSKENFKNRKFRGDSEGSRRGDGEGKKHELDVRNRGNKKVKFDSDDE